MFVVRPGTMTHDKECSHSQFVSATQINPSGPFVLAGQNPHRPKQPHRNPKTPSAELLVTVDLSI
jgi:hypothetical protein